MKYLALVKTAAVFLALIAFTRLAEGSDVRLSLADRVSIVIPDSLEYTARLSDGSLKSSDDGQEGSLPTGFLLGAHVFRPEGILLLYVSYEDPRADMNAKPTESGFSLEGFAERHERRSAKRHTGVKNTIQRIELAQRNQGDAIIIDHQYYLLAGSDPASQVFFHDVFVYRRDAVTILHIEFPKMAEDEWAAPMKAVTESLDVEK